MPDLGLPVLDTDAALSRRAENPKSFGLALGQIPDGPLAIAVSGGGDSTALMHGLRAKKPLVLIVDHGLRRGSKSEAEQTARLARALGLSAQILTWAPKNKPQSGLQAKARRARYALMGEACRAAGVPYLLTAHTQNDQAETLLMRYARQTSWRGAAGMEAAAYAPIWPELAGVTIIRPLLGATRAELRAYNIKHELKWIEDPSNQNTDFARIRARRYLAAHPAAARRLLLTASELSKGRAAERARFRGLTDRQLRIDNAGIIYLKGTVPPAYLALLLRCASGGDHIESREAVSRLLAHMHSPEFTGATLSGAYVMKDKDQFIIGPDPSVYKGRKNRAALPPVTLHAGQSLIWDGRFLIKAPKDVRITLSDAPSLNKLAPDAQEAARRALSATAAAFRPSLPLIWDMSVPGAAQLGINLPYVSPLVAPRLQRSLEP